MKDVKKMQHVNANKPNVAFGQNVMILLHFETYKFSTDRDQRTGEHSTLFCFISIIIFIQKFIPKCFRILQNN